MGAIDRAKREWQDGLQHARWAGFFAQVKITEHAKLMKQMLNGKPKSKVMSGKAIGATLRAWAARSK